MKNIAIISFLMSLSAHLFAQQKPQIIHRDTINLRGYIYDEQGKPVKHLYIHSAHLDFVHNAYKVGCVTDTNGYFEIKGAKFDDTLTMNQHIAYNTRPFYNKGSRYMVIYLSSKVSDINSSNPVEVSHKREIRKIIPIFTITPDEDEHFYSEIHMPAHFKNELGTFTDYIQQHLTYPEAAIKKNIEGIVQIGFAVERDGSLVYFKVLRGIGYNCEQAVMDVIKKSPKWSPAIDNGLPFISKQIVTVKFVLTDNQ